MPSFVFTYRLTPGYVRTAESAEAWRSWFDGMDGQVADIGKPGLAAAALGNCGPATQLGGYSLINAADMNEALALAKGCPEPHPRGRHRGRAARRSAAPGRRRRPVTLRPSRSTSSLAVKAVVGVGRPARPKREPGQPRGGIQLRL